MTVVVPGESPHNLSAPSLSSYSRDSKRARHSAPPGFSTPWEERQQVMLVR